MIRRLVVTLVMGSASVLAMTSDAAAQGGRARGPRAGGAVVGRQGLEAATPAAAEALFERLVVRQARAALQLTPSDMRAFEPRFLHLQAVRRRLQRERQRLLNNLALATRATPPMDEALVQGRLEALELFRATADAELREVTADVDAVLTVPQRARLRVFERRIERQKLELMARARREAAARGTGNGSRAP